ncbi:MAG: response regulator [Thermodesulfobacteriota bacterium]
MKKSRILVVEDESIIARNVQNKLTKLGYDVCGVTSTGEDAIKLAKELNPDLVLMDIVLRGGIDGIDAAKHIRSQFDIPIIYLTAHSDLGTIKRATYTEPFGYILKPFKIKEIQSAIEIALHKHKAESRIKSRKKAISNALTILGYSIIAVDKDLKITFLSESAEQMTGWRLEEAIDKNLYEIIKLKHGEELSHDNVLLVSAFQSENVDNLVIKKLINAKYGRELFIEIKANPIRSDMGELGGVLLILKEVREENPSGLDSQFDVFKSALSSQRPISLVVISRQTLVPEGLAKILESEKDINIVATAREIGELLPFIEHKKPDVILIDTDLNQDNKGRIIEFIKTKTFDSKILLLLHYHDEKFITNALNTGVSGLIYASSTGEDICEAIRTVNLGRSCSDTEIIKKFVTKILPKKKRRPVLLRPRLTNKEQEVASLVSQGLSNNAIAQKLRISERTVKAHLNNIFKKLGISNRLQLAIEYQP